MEDIFLGYGLSKSKLCIYNIHTMNILSTVLGQSVFNDH